MLSNKNLFDFSIFKPVNIEYKKNKIIIRSEYKLLKLLDIKNNFESHIIQKKNNFVCKVLWARFFIVPFVSKNFKMENELKSLILKMDCKKSMKNNNSFLCCNEIYVICIEKEFKRIFKIYKDKINYIVVLKSNSKTNLS